VQSLKRSCAAGTVVTTAAPRSPCAYDNAIYSRLYRDVIGLIISGGRSCQASMGALLISLFKLQAGCADREL
jgi:hypothetical protein